MSGGQGGARKPQRSAELAAGQVEHRTGEDGSAAALDGLACRDRRSSRGCGGRVFSPAPLTTEGDSLLPAGREGGGWVGGRLTQPCFTPGVLTSQEAGVVDRLVAQLKPLFLPSPPEDRA